MVHAQAGDHQVETVVREGQPGRVADHRPGPVGVGRQVAGGVRDHVGRDIQAGQLEVGPAAGELHQQPARAGPDVQDLGTGRRDPGDVGRRSPVDARPEPVGVPVVAVGAVALERLVVVPVRPVRHDAPPGLCHTTVVQHNSGLAVEVPQRLGRIGGAPADREQRPEEAVEHRGRRGVPGHHGRRRRRQPELAARGGVREHRVQPVPAQPEELGDQPAGEVAADVGPVVAGIPGRGPVPGQERDLVRAELEALVHGQAEVGGAERLAVGQQVVEVRVEVDQPGVPERRHRLLQLPVDQLDRGRTAVRRDLLPQPGVHGGGPMLDEQHERRRRLLDRGQPLPHRLRPVPGGDLPFPFLEIRFLRLPGQDPPVVQQREAREAAGPHPRGGQLVGGQLAPGPETGRADPVLVVGRKPEQVRGRARPSQLRPGHRDLLDEDPDPSTSRVPVGPPIPWPPGTRPSRRAASARSDSGASAAVTVADRSRRLIRAVVPCQSWLPATRTPCTPC